MSSDINKMLPTLPPKSTALERAVVAACAPLGEVPVPLRTLWNINDCPVEFLPHLAWAFSVDRWEVSWPASMKRNVIKASFYIHKHKGTIAAVRRVVESLGYLIRIIEWWQTEPPGTPGTFQLQVGVLDSGVTDVIYQEMERLIADAKPESRHMTGLSIQLESKGQIILCLASFDGDEMTVYPYQTEEIVVHGLLIQQGATHIIDTMTVYQ